MEMQIANLFKKAITIPEPDKYPNFNNVEEWMNKKVEYFAATNPNEMYKLFCPSCGDYLPALIVVGTSEKTLKTFLEQYREIKKRYPEMVKLAKANFNEYAYYRVGDPTDFPAD